MIKKLFLIVGLLCGYVYIVSTDPEGSMLGKAQKFYSYCQDRYKGMNLKYEVNAFPQENSKNIKENKNSKTTKAPTINSRKQRNF
jgi:hypothetical protein